MSLVVRVEGDNARVARGQVIATRRGMRVADVEARYSTPEMLATERQLIVGATKRVGEGAGIADAEQVDAALTVRSYLADEQAAMVRALTTSGDGVQVVLAKAGAGKTTALDAAREAWQRSGLVVHGTALGSFATKELRDSGIDACTTARLMLDVQRYGLPRGSVLVVDEAGMVGTRQLASLARHAEEAGAKLVLVGDDHQLPEIDAGGAFRGLADRLGAIELQENRRQQDPADRQALDAYRAGRPEELVELLRRQGRVAVAPDVGQTRAGLVRDWWEGAEAEGLENVAMIALRRSEVRELNELARDTMRQAGRLGDREIVLDGDRAFVVGDRVVTRQNAPRLGVVNGSRGELVGFSDDGAMQVRLDDGGQVVGLPAEYATARRGEQPYVEHGYAITANGIQGGTTHRAYVLGSDELYREWGYVAFSRHRHELRFYVTAPDVPENQQLELGAGAADPLAQITRALGESRAKTFAIDVAADDQLRDMPDDRLLSEAGHLRQVLETAPPAAARTEIDRLAGEVSDAEAKLTETLADRDATAAVLERARRRDRPVLQQRLAGTERAVAHYTETAQALDAERSALIDEHGDPDMWTADREAQLSRLADVELELHRRDGVRRAEALRMVTVDPPAYVTDEFGNRPEEPTGRRAWDRGARAIESYRQRYGASIAPDQPGLGDRPTERRVRFAHQAASREVNRARVTLDRPAVPAPEVGLDIGPKI